jgi:molybdopterin synthase catalytic subunit
LPGGPNIYIAKSAIDPDALAARFRKEHASAGAIASFIGQTRSEGGAVEALVLEHYPGFTEQEIKTIVDSALSRWPLHAVSVFHRVGRMVPEEPIVFVAAAADHRRAAIEAIDFLMDYLKSEAPFWKREITAEGARWVEPTDQDQRDKARWTS